MLKIKRRFSFIALLAFYQESQSLVTVTVSDYSVRVLVPINLAVLCVNLTLTNPPLRIKTAHQPPARHVGTTIRVSQSGGTFRTEDVRLS